MRLAQIFAVMMGIMAVIHSIGRSEESPTAPTKTAKPWLERRLPHSDIRNPIIQRIDSLTWEDKAMKEQLALFPEKTRAKIADADESQQRGYLLRARNQIKLKYVDEGGAVLPVSANCGRSHRPVQVTCAKAPWHP